MTTDNPLKTLAEELKKVPKRRVKEAFTWEGLARVVEDAADGGRPIAEEDFVTSDASPAITHDAPPDFPRLLAPYGIAGKFEYVVVNSQEEWNPYRTWTSVFPPSGPANKPVLVTFAGELARLKSEGATERPKEEWQRRKETRGYTTNFAQ